MRVKPWHDKWVPDLFKARLRHDCFMVVALAALLAVVGFVILMRLLWLKGGSPRYSGLITVAAAALVLGLALLAASGRLHWLAALGAALLPFLRQGLGLLRFFPLLRSLGGSGRRSSQGAGSGRARAGVMSRSEALEILGLGQHPTREEIYAAHRRLIQKLHPDRGGSKYLAQQINEAKERLLEEL
jgi:DnaJ homolog subfamily C member 19